MDRPSARQYHPQLRQEGWPRRAVRGVLRPTHTRDRAAERGSDVHRSGRRLGQHGQGRRAKLLARGYASRPTARNTERSQKWDGGRRRRGYRYLNLTLTLAARRVRLLVGGPAIPDDEAVVAGLVVCRSANLLRSDLDHFFDSPGICRVRTIRESEP